jgi:hypothetical protein
MYKLLTPRIEDHGIFANHDYPCPVCLKEHAVLNMQTGVFQPCWLCQTEGFRTYIVPRWLRKLLARYKA